jgi:SAM-dependent methyltransferase
MTNGVQYWDAIASTKWGRYISAAEEGAIESAQATAPAPRAALDAGCGGGRWTRLLLDRGWSVTGFDVDPDAVRAHRDRNPEADCLIVDPNNERLPVADGAASLVVCIEVLAVAHSAWFPGEARRVLAPGGRVVAVVWNRHSLRGLLADWSARVRTEGSHPHYCTSYRDWRARLRRAGFTIDAEQGLCWFPFGRSSESRLISTCVVAERWLGLARLPSMSPWVLVTACRLPEE